MSKLRMKVSKNGKIYLARVIADGRIQRAFAKTMSPLGQCIKGATEGKSHDKGEKLKILQGCLDANNVKKGMHLTNPDGTAFVPNKNGYYTRKLNGQVGHGQPYSKV